LYYREAANFEPSKDILTETNAVNSEFEIDLKNPGWIAKIMQQHVGDNKKSPWNKFDIGNFRTLKHKGVWNEVAQFYKNFYTTRNMVVTVIGDAAEMSSVEKILSKPGKSLSDKPEKLKLKYAGKPFSELPAILLVPSKVRPKLEFKFWVKDSGMSPKTVNDYLVYITHYWSEVLMQKLFGEKFYVNEVSLSLVKAGFLTELTVGLNLTHLGTSKI
jgi:secreted Zn-dependent insulinase-like peptidase